MNNGVEVADDKSHNERHPSTNTKAHISWPRAHFWRQTNRQRYLVKCMCCATGRDKENGTDALDRGGGGG
ncbi:unnamed protein product [Acanthocheilonema viteae]|uniref:Uncharacterized protein n=1 Tax=Acanthocheilonema viteae TaxID=6277 RepID=A0A498S6A8_ACAVI|nr:unnamed protein product [Acanthocheilonema viteae]